MDDLTKALREFFHFKPSKRVHIDEPEQQWVVEENENEDEMYFVIGLGSDK